MRGCTAAGTSRDTCCYLLAYMDEATYLAIAVGMWPEAQDR
jgi:hypothetical protein